jgi:hypothetical protein
MLRPSSPDTCTLMQQSDRRCTHVLGWLAVAPPPLVTPSVGAVSEMTFTGVFVSAGSSVCSPSICVLHVERRRPDSRMIFQGSDDKAQTGNSCCGQSVCLPHFRHPSSVLLLKRRSTFSLSICIYIASQQWLPPYLALAGAEWHDQSMQSAKACKGSSWCCDFRCQLQAASPPACWDYVSTAHMKQGKRHLLHTLSLYLDHRCLSLSPAQHNINVSSGYTCSIPANLKCKHRLKANPSEQKMQA